MDKPSKALVSFLLNAMFYFLRSELRGSEDRQERGASLEFADDYDSWGEYDDEECEDDDLGARCDLTQALRDYWGREMEPEEADGLVRDAFLALLRECDCPEDSSLYQQAQAQLRRLED